MTKKFSETEECKRIFKNAGRKIYEVENYGRKNSEVLLQTFPADLTNIKPPNQHDKPDLNYLQKLLYWYKTIQRVNTNSDLYASTVSTTTFLAHNNLSFVRTQSTVHVPHYVKNNPPPPSNG